MVTGPTSASSSHAAPRELLSGIDALDLTCKTPAPKRLLDDLGELQQQARENEREAVTLDVGDVRLRVSAKGFGSWWPFALEHGRFGRLAVGDGAGTRPAWRVSPSAEALHCEGVHSVVEFWRSIIESLSGSPAVLMVSRLDLHSDFAGLGISEADRESFICPSDAWRVVGRGSLMETLYLGKGDLSVRIYDKLAEVKSSGGGGYLLEAYGSAGLRVGESVQRLEAQIRRRTLRQLGVERVEDVIGRAGPVYAYVTGKWLRLVDLSTATRRERAALDPRWAVVQAASIAAGIDPARRLVAERHAPNIDTITANFYGWLVSAGAALGISEPNVVARRMLLLADAYGEDKGRNFAREVKVRMGDYGSPAVA